MSVAETLEDLPSHAQTVAADLAKLWAYVKDSDDKELKLLVAHVHHDSSDALDALCGFLSLDRAYFLPDEQPAPRSGGGDKPPRPN